jgi:hypothetical protein
VRSMYWNREVKSRLYEAFILAERSQLENIQRRRRFASGLLRFSNYIRALAHVERLRTVRQKIRSCFHCTTPPPKFSFSARVYQSTGCVYRFKKKFLFYSAEMIFTSLYTVNNKMLARKCPRPHHPLSQERRLFVFLHF